MDPVDRYNTFKTEINALQDQSAKALDREKIKINLKQILISYQEELAGKKKQIKFIRSYNILAATCALEKLAEPEKKTPKEVLAMLQELPLEEHKLVLDQVNLSSAGVVKDAWIWSMVSSVYNKVHDVYNQLTTTASYYYNQLSAHEQIELKVLLLENEQLVTSAQESKEN